MAIVKRLASEDYVSTAAAEITEAKLDEHVVSWNDLSDRPFGGEVDGVGEIFNNNFMMSVNEAIYPIPTTFNNTVPVEAGKQYTVKFVNINGTSTLKEYVVVASLNDEGLIDISPNPDTDGFSYVIRAVPVDKIDEIGYGVYIDTKSDAIEFTLKIDGPCKVMQTLDERYISDTIARKTDIPDPNAPRTELILTSSTSDSTKKFKITIDDEGVLTATEIVESET